MMIRLASPVGLEMKEALIFADAREKDFHC
jgi:hypothetical protein